jgi:hypothetical protein
MADEPEGKPADETPAEPKLPVVWSPKLDAEAEAAISKDFPHADAEETTSFAADEEAYEEAGEPNSAPTGDASPPRSRRFAMLAASIVAAAALGSFAGSFAALGIAQLWPAGPAGANMAANSPQLAKAELAELAMLRASLDAAARNAGSQFAKLADRLDHIEHAQVEPSLKLARIADAVDRLEKKNVQASAAGSAAPEATGSIPSPAAPAEAKLPENVLPDWVVQDVRGGRALVQHRYGGMFEVAAGSVLPGLGRVEAVKRQDGQWVVVTAHGVIIER